MRKEVRMFSKMENFCFIIKSQNAKNQAKWISKRKTLLSSCSFCLAKVRQIILAEKWFYRKFSGFFKAAISCVKIFRIRQEIFIVCLQIFICSEKIFIQNFWTYIQNFGTYIQNIWTHIQSLWINIICDKM